MMSKKKLLLSFLLVLCCMGAAAKEYSYRVEKIWDNGFYNAFTSLIKYKGYYYCAFREGKGHVFDEETGKAEGKIRIIRSRNLKKWESVLLTGEADKDFRDPKLSIMPDGRLMVSIGITIYVNREEKDQYSCSFFSSDGIHFTQPQRCQIKDNENHRNDWIWRVTWQGDTGYAVDYYTRKDNSPGMALLSTKDGISFQPLAEFQIPGFPNEATVRFHPDGRMAVMVRRDDTQPNTYWAMSQPPFTQWEWKEIPFYMGGPDFQFMNENCIVSGGRSIQNPKWATTDIYTGNPETGRMHRIVTLPSGGDTSYPGIIVDDKEVLVSYYAGHETRRPSIYLARIPLKNFDW